MRHKKLILIPAVLLALAFVVFVYPFNLYIEETAGDATPTYSITIFLVTPINRQVDADHYFGQTLVYQQTYWHQCANRNETHYYDGPCELEEYRHWVSNSAVGVEVGKLHYDNFDSFVSGSPWTQTSFIVIVVAIVGLAIGCVGMMFAYVMYKSPSNADENTKKEQP